MRLDENQAPKDSKRYQARSGRGGIKGDLFLLQTRLTSFINGRSTSRGQKRHITNSNPSTKVSMMIGQPKRLALVAYRYKVRAR